MSKETSTRVLGKKDENSTASIDLGMPAGVNPMPVASSDPSTSIVTDRTGSGDPNAPGMGTLQGEPRSHTVSEKYPNWSERHPDLDSPYGPSKEPKRTDTPVISHIDHPRGELDDKRQDDGTIRTASFNPLSTPKEELQNVEDEDKANDVPAHKGSL